MISPFFSGFSNKMAELRCCGRALRLCLIKTCTLYCNVSEPHKNKSWLQLMALTTACRRRGLRLYKLFQSPGFPSPHTQLLFVSKKLRDLRYMSLPSSCLWRSKMQRRNAIFRAASYTGEMGVNQSRVGWSWNKRHVLTLLGCCTCIAASRGIKASLCLSSSVSHRSH
jgi:hypothetical protein